MADSCAGSTNTTPAVSVTHGLDCKLHESPLSTQCNATTTRKLPCRRAPDRSRYFPDVLPVCKQHKDTQIQAGHCQAIAECGRRCDRLAISHPPFNLCGKHANGTDTLPCHLLKLPAELRVLIWRYTLPESISPYSRWHPKRRDQVQQNMFSLLRVNRQISREALSVVYGEVPFEVAIEGDHIHICGRVSNTTPTPYSKTQGHSLFDLDISGIGLLPVLGRIRNFIITMELGGTPRSIHLGIPVGRQAITPEDYYVFHTRDKLKKLADAIHREHLAHTDEEGVSNSVRGLDLRLRFDEFHAWHFDEALSMVIMAAESFKVLGSVQKPDLHDILSPPITTASLESGLERFNAEFLTYKLEWQTAMSQSVGAASQTPMGPSQSRIDKSKKELQKIEEFATFLQNQDLTTFGFDYLTMGDPSNTPFHNIARVIHLARVASDQFDLYSLAKIRDVLLERWADHQKKQQQESKRVASSLLNLFEGAKPTEAFLAHESKLTAVVQDSPEVRFDCEWPELDVRHFFTKRISSIPEDGTTCTEDREYRYFYKNGKFRGAALKTPFFVRHTSSIKRATF
ncbi:hypothetical protein PSPO01_10450 [Paraphaeosphaeria sporulosa]